MGVVVIVIVSHERDVTQAHQDFCPLNVWHSHCSHHAHKKRGFVKLDDTFEEFWNILGTTDTSLYTKHKQMLWEAALPMECVCHHFHHWWVCSRTASWAVRTWLDRSPGTPTQQQAHFPCLDLWLSCIDYNIIFLTTIIIISIGLALALLRRRLCASKWFISSALGTRVSVKENTILKKVGKLIIEPALLSTLPGLEENFFEESAGPGDRKQFLLSVQHPATIYLGPRFLFKCMEKIFFFLSINGFEKNMKNKIKVIINMESVKRTKYQVIV